MSVIALEEVSFAHNHGQRNENWVIKDLSLELELGEVFGIVGPSGSGKSTLLGLMSLLLTPTEGLLYALNRNITHASPRQKARIRRKFGLVTQASDLDPSLTAAENITLLGKLIGVGWANAEFTRNILNEVGLPEDAHNQLPHRLSVGERQRVSIARAVYYLRDVIFADEPTSALDREMKVKVMDLMVNQVKAHGSTRPTLVVVSHDEDLVLPYCSRYIRMPEGKITVQAA